jgi:hypothetical protein
VKPEGQFGCCSFCQPDNAYQEENEARAATLQMQHLAVSLRSDGTFSALLADQKKAVILMLKKWRAVQWYSNMAPNEARPSEELLPDYLVAHLATKLHLLTDYSRFKTVMAEWDPSDLENYGAKLYEFCHPIIQACSDETRRQKKAKANEKDADGSANQSVGTGSAQPEEVLRHENAGKRRGPPSPKKSPHAKRTRKAHQEEHQPIEPLKLRSSSRLKLV